MDDGATCDNMLQYTNCALIYLELACKNLEKNIEQAGAELCQAKHSLS